MEKQQEQEALRNREKKRKRAHEQIFIWGSRLNKKEKWCFLPSAYNGAGLFNLRLACIARLFSISSGQEQPITYYFLHWHIFWLARKRIFKKTI